MFSDEDIHKNYEQDSYGAGNATSPGLRRLAAGTHASGRHRSHSIKPTLKAPARAAEHRDEDREQ